MRTRYVLPALFVVPAAAALATVTNEPAGAPGMPVADRSTAPADRPVTGRDLHVETLVSGLDTPWDLSWGPDGHIWVTERPGRISRVNAATGERTPVAELEVLEVGESGLMGMAFHPDFESQPYVYLVHTYGGGRDTRNRLVRMRYEEGRLGRPETLLEDVPGARIHDGSRLAVGPDGFLYMTTGDAGRPQLAQDLGSLGGKLLRLTLDGQPAPGNPFGSHVYSYGHRNAQGLDFHPTTGVLYSAEHGPGDNDEVNVIRIGGNYGWPDVHGFCDGDTPGEEAFCRDWPVEEPLSAWTPTIGISGLAVYDADLIPGWKGSLLVTALRGTALWRLTLSADGTEVVSREALFQGEYGRLRDVLVGPGGEVYLATSNHDARGRPAPDDDRILRIVP